MKQNSSPVTSTNPVTLATTLPYESKVLKIEDQGDTKDSLAISQPCLCMHTDTDTHTPLPGW